MEYLYRLSAGDEALLYVGITNDWTRRLREHWLNKPWAEEILNVTLESFPDRAAVSAAERLAIYSERPRYNIQHNLDLGDDSGSAGGWTAGDVLLIAGLVIVAGYALYVLTEAAINRYREWKLNREEYLQWKRDRDRQRLDEQSPGQDEGRMAADHRDRAGDEVPRLSGVEPLHRLWTSADGSGYRAAHPVTTSLPSTPTDAPGPLGIVAMAVFAAFAGRCTATLVQPVAATGSPSPRQCPPQELQQRSGQDGEPQGS